MQSWDSSQRPPSHPAAHIQTRPEPSWSLWLTGGDPRGQPGWDGEVHCGRLKTPARSGDLRRVRGVGGEGGWGTWKKGEAAALSSAWPLRRRRRAHWSLVSVSGRVGIHSHNTQMSWAWICHMGLLIMVAKMFFPPCFFNCLQKYYSMPQNLPELFFSVKKKKKVTLKIFSIYVTGDMIVAYLSPVMNPPGDLQTQRPWCLTVQIKNYNLPLW